MDRAQLADFLRRRRGALQMMTVQCQLLHDHDQGQALLVYTATPGTDSYQRLQLLSVIGTQRISPTS